MNIDASTTTPAANRPVQPHLPDNTMDGIRPQPISDERPSATPTGFISTLLTALGLKRPQVLRPESVDLGLDDVTPPLLTKAEAEAQEYEEFCDEFLRITAK